MMKPSLLLSVAVGLTLMLGPQARAGLIIDVQDATIGAGGTGTLDVLIHSNSSDILDLANYQFLITPVGAPGSSLEFQDPQDESEQFDSDYVFFGDSLGLLTFVNSPTDVEGSDLTFSGLGVQLDSTDRLLVRLDLQHVFGGGQSAADAAGEQFTVSLFVNPDPLSNLSFFDDPLTDPIPFIHTSGTVTVAQAAAVPEPSTISIFGFGAICLVGLRRRRRK